MKWKQCFPQQMNPVGSFVRLFAHYFMHKHALSTLRKIKNPNHRASRGIKTNICAGISRPECIQKELATQSHEKKSERKKTKNYGMFIYFGRWANLPAIHFVHVIFMHHEYGIRYQTENKFSTFKMRSHRMQCTHYGCLLLLDAFGFHSRQQRNQNGCFCKNNNKSK